MAEVIDGKAIAATVRAELRERVQRLNGRDPGLAMIIVGDRKDSMTYVRTKHKACEECGIASFQHNLPESSTFEEIIDLIQTLNADERVHGILVQLPMPKHVDEERVLALISLDKDVDGFHPINIGRLAMKNRTPLFIPCTPQGCMELLKRHNVLVAGKRAVVLGRSNIVGIPCALLLMQANATVTICHSGTVDIAAEVRRADIVIAAVGSPEMVKGDWLQPGAVVIDVGMNFVKDESKPKGYRMAGDVDYDSCKEVAGAITPVPGGVGPMTVAMLLKNTVIAAERAFDVSVTKE